MKKRITLDHQGPAVVELRNRDGIYEPVIDHEALKKWELDQLTVTVPNYRSAAF